MNAIFVILKEILKKKRNENYALMSMKYSKRSIMKLPYWIIKIKRK